MKTIMNGVLRLLAWVHAGRPMVSRFLADERARICEECPLNAMKQRRAVTRAFAWLVGLPSTVRGRLNGTCDACGCDLPIKVWLPLTTMDKPHRSMPGNCWVRIELAKKPTRLALRRSKRKPST